MRSFKQALCFIMGLAVSARVAEAMATPRLSARFSGVDIDGQPTDASGAVIPTTPAASDLAARAYTAPVTNAKRMAMGLPPLPPTRRSKREVSSYHPKSC